MPRELPNVKPWPDLTHRKSERVPEEAQCGKSRGSPGTELLNQKDPAPTRDLPWHLEMIMLVTAGQAAEGHCWHLVGGVCRHCQSSPGHRTAFPSREWLGPKCQCAELEKCVLAQSSCFDQCPGREGGSLEVTRPRCGGEAAGDLCSRVHRLWDLNVRLQILRVRLFLALGARGRH